jgi:hypothetical protein
MTRDDIIRMARQAGLCTWVVPPQGAVEQLERFAALVAAAEREECAKLIEDKFDFCGDELIAAAAIRARGNNEH